MKNVLIALGLGVSVLSASTSLQAQAPACDSDCLKAIAGQYLEDVAKQDFSQLPWAGQVRYTENNVAMMIGDGFWGAGPSVAEGLMLADPQSGNVVWFGITAEHGQAAYHGLRLKVEQGRISEVESLLGREGQPDLFAPVADYRIDRSFSRAVPAAQRSPRERMQALVDGWYNSLQLNDGKLFTELSGNCQRIINGVNTTRAPYWAGELADDCAGQLALGLYKPVDRVRARRYPVIDETLGVVVALSLEDHAVRYLDYQATDGSKLHVEVEYPNTRGKLELFKIENGAISRIEGVSAFLPYYIHSLW